MLMCRTLGRWFGNQSALFFLLQVFLVELVHDQGVHIQSLIYLWAAPQAP